jgi:hypothetical protein
LADFDVRRRAARFVPACHFGTDGFIKSVHAIAPADPDFATSALDAVGQWQFTTTRLSAGFGVQGSGFSATRI